MESNKFFETSRPGRLFFTVAVPGMISMLAMSIYNVIEGVFIGNLLGEAAFAAVNIAMPFVLINFSLADMVGVGSSVPISIALGRKDKERANNIFTCSIILILLAAAFMGIILFSTAPALVRILGARGILAELSVKYIRVYAALGPVTTLVFAMDNYLRICGFVKSSMALNIFMSCLTAGLLYLFICVFKMNVEGSALATSLAMSFCALIALIPFLRRRTLLKFVNPKFTINMIKEIVSCGAPTFLNNMAGRVASIVMNVMLLRIGGQQAVAVYSVLMYANEVIQPLLYGISDSVQPSIGYNWGARKLLRVKALAKYTFCACAVVSFVGFAAMFFLPETISALFIESGDGELLKMSAEAMKLFCLAYIFRWFGFATQSFLSAIEKPRPAAILSVMGALVFPVALIFILLPTGLNGLWLNLAASSALVALLSAFMLKKLGKEMANK